MEGTRRFQADPKFKKRWERAYRAALPKLKANLHARQAEPGYWDKQRAGVRKWRDAGKTRSCKSCLDEFEGSPNQMLCAFCKNKNEHRRYLAELVARNGPNCALCGQRINFLLDARKPMGATIDHKKARSNGGKTNIKNLQLAHRTCNEKKGRK